MSMMEMDPPERPTARLKRLLRSEEAAEAGEFWAHLANTTKVKDPNSWFYRLTTLESHFWLFRSALLVLEKRTGLFPMVQIGDDHLPADPRFAAPQPRGDLGTVISDAWSLALTTGHSTNTATPSGARVTLAGVDTAAESFSSGFMGAINNFTTSGASTLPFEVHAKNHKYRVEYTDFYWFSPSVFGSGVTSPAKGHLPPADYKFGGDKGSGTIWDAGKHTVSATNARTTVTAF